MTEPLQTSVESADPLVYLMSVFLSCMHSQYPVNLDSIMLESVVQRQLAPITTNNTSTTPKHL